MQFALPLAVLVLSSLCACRSTSEGDEIEFARVFSVQVSQFQEPKNVVARSADEWSAYFGTALEPPIEIDWSQRMLVAVALGSRPSGGYAVEIDSITRQGSHWIVHARESRPAPGSFQTTMMTSPVDCVSTPRFDGKVVFVLE